MSIHSAALRVLLIPAILLMAVPSCKSNLEEKVNDLENRVSKLESQVNQMNDDLSQLQTLVQRLSEGKLITRWEPSANGYLLIFSDNTSIELKHGNDGSTPAIGIKKDDTDGNWYWTLDGAWLKDAAGKRVRANGNDGAPGESGITPRVKVENGYWWLSTDNGANWTQLAPYQDAAGSLVRSVDASSSERYVIITLSDNTVINVPKRSNLSIAFEQTEVVTFVPGETRDINFTLSGGTEKNNVKAFGQGGWIARVSMTSATQGKLSVTAPDPLVEIEVVVLVSDGEGYVIIASLDLVKGIISFDNTSANAGVAGGQVSLSVTANTDYDTPVIDAAWVTLVPPSKAATRQDQLFFKVLANNGFERACTVKLYKEGRLMSTAAITQDGGFAYEGFGIVNSETVIYGHGKSGGQMGVYRSEGRSWCRLLNPETDSCYEIGPIVDGIQTGDSFTATLSLNTKGQTMEESERVFKVYSYADGILKMQDNTGDAYIVRL